MFRRHHHACAAGVSRRGRARLLAAGTLRPDFLRAWHDHDLLRGDATRNWTYELRGSAATRYPRRGVPDNELHKLLVDRIRRSADERIAWHRRVREDRLGRLPAA